MLKNILINKQKRLFLIFGFLNFLITNAVLQICLLFSSVLFSTILSQIINLLIGYNLYDFGVNKNITALSIIPLLVIISYFFQKRYVFK